MSIPPDYFLRQFDRYPEGEPRLAAMAAHAALLFNSLKEKQAEHVESVRRTLNLLCDANPIAQVARDLCEQLHDMESDR